MISPIVLLIFTLILSLFNVKATSTSRPTASPTTATPTFLSTAAPTSTVPILYLPFDGNASDVSGYNHTTFIQGSVTLTTDRYGNANSAYSFNYAGQIQIVDSQALAIGPGDYTIAMWIKPNTPITNTAAGYLYSHGDAVSCSISGYQLGILNNYIYQGMACPGGCAVQSSGTTLLSNGVWYFVANTVKRGGLATIYINGVVDTAVSNVSTCDLSDYRTNVNGVKNKGVFVGGDVGNYQFYGAIDDVQIYNRALSINEVQALYAESTVPPTPLPTTYPSYAGLTGPILYLPFDGNASDVSGYNHQTHVQNSTFLTTDRFGNANSAYRFTYAGQIQVIDSDLLAIGSDDYSIAMWIKSTGALTNTGRLFSHGSAQSCSVTGYQLSLVNNYVYQEFSCPFGCGLSSRGNIQLSNNVWYYVVNSVQRGGSASIYINGVLDVSVSNISRCNFQDYRVGNNIRVKDKGVYVGGDVGTYQFYGSIDEVKVYNRAISADEALAMYYASAGAVPTFTPSSLPTVSPTSSSPTFSPTSSAPTVKPTFVPSFLPTSIPSSLPTFKPSSSPSIVPTVSPSISALSSAPSVTPSVTPSKLPTSSPSTTPTKTPSSKPTQLPTLKPSSSSPTKTPSFEPSTLPTKLPTFGPTANPTSVPTKIPTVSPSKVPTTEPSSVPSKSPSYAPTKLPSKLPTTIPTKVPTLAPTSKITSSPSCDCTSVCMANPYCFYPTVSPTHSPVFRPTIKPTVKPTVSPTSFTPTFAPSFVPTNPLDVMKSLCLASPFCSGNFSVPSFTGPDLNNKRSTLIKAYCIQQSYCVLPTQSPTNSPVY